MIFFPQIPRCRAGSPPAPPDIGYAYDALDYVIGGAVLDTGASLTVLPGTSVGFTFDCYWGIALESGSSLISHGTPLKPVNFSPAAMVQDGPFTWGDLGCPGFIISFMPDHWPDSQNPPPSLDFRFSNSNLGSGWSHHIWGGKAYQYLWLFAKIWTPWTGACSAVDLLTRDSAFYNGWINLGEINRLCINSVWQVWMPSGAQDAFGSPIPCGVALFNNLFDHVNLNLDPDTGPTWWPGYWHSFDTYGLPLPTETMTLGATNNLFHGGWLYTASVNLPEGTEHWTFENNLFDKTVFAQDTRMPLDYDYNAYWPCPAGDRYTGQNATLLPGSDSADRHGVHDINPLPVDPENLYVSGPFGDFYQARTYLDGGQTPANPLIGHGSTTADQLGLYHYTTTAGLQTKLATSTADIGISYVATTGTTPPVLDDGDTDGIPDYLENWHGDGATSPNNHPDETDWAALPSQSVSHPCDSLYDEKDLDGDGLTGLAEKALFPGSSDAPVIPSNPLSLSHVVTPDAPDIESFALRDWPQQPPTTALLRLFVDGKAPHLQGRDAPHQGNPTMIWNVTYEQPGPHILQPMLFCGQDGSASAPGPLLRFDSAKGVTFSEATAQFTAAQANLFALTKWPEDVACTIRIFDGTIPEGTGAPLVTVHTTSSAGKIAARWDLRCEDETTFSGKVLRAQFETHPPPDLPGEPSTTDNQILNLSTASTSDGTFDVAFMWDDGTVTTPHYGEMWIGMQRVVNTLLQPRQSTVLEYHSWYNTFSYDLESTFPGYVPDLPSTDTLYNSLVARDTKNFLYEGHGGPKALSDGTGAFGHPVLYLDLMHYQLGNWDDTRGGFVINHPYRFVFLDGCNTASTPDWQHLFGIADYDYERDGMVPSGMGPQAFVGWCGKFHSRIVSPPPKAQTFLARCLPRRTKANGQTFAPW